jgi:hypothetical protein
MLRMYFPQVWNNLSGEAIERNIYGSYAMRKFMRPGYFKEDVPDAARCRSSGICLKSTIYRKSCSGRRKS